MWQVQGFTGLQSSPSLSACVWLFVLARESVGADVQPRGRSARDRLGVRVSTDREGVARYSGDEHRLVVYLDVASWFWVEGLGFGA